MTCNLTHATRLVRLGFVYSEVKSKLNGHGQTKVSLTCQHTANLKNTQNKHALLACLKNVHDTLSQVVFEL